MDLPLQKYLPEPSRPSDSTELYSSTSFELSWISNTQFADDYSLQTASLGLKSDGPRNRRSYPLQKILSEPPHPSDSMVLHLSTPYELSWVSNPEFADDYSLQTASLGLKSDASRNRQSYLHQKCLPEPPRPSDSMDLYSSTSFKSCWVSNPEFADDYSLQTASLDSRSNES